MNTSGCDNSNESKLIQVKGRVTIAGEPLQVEGFDVGIGAVRVAFHPIMNGEKVGSASSDTAADQEGHFKIREGLPAGEYCIVIEQWDPHPVLERLEGRFNLRNSQIVRTISHEQAYLDIDLANEASASDLRLH